MEGRKPFSMRAGLGVLAIIVQPWLLAVRAKELTESMSRFQVADLSPLAVFGMHYSFGMVMGIALTFAAMIAASVFKVETSSTPPCRYLQILAGGGWLAFFLVQILLSVRSGVSWQEQVAATGAPLTMMLFETMAGILIIEHTFPETKALVSGIVAALARGSGWQKGSRPGGSRIRRRGKPVVRVTQVRGKKRESDSAANQDAPHKPDVAA